MAKILLIMFLAVTIVIGFPDLNLRKDDDFTVSHESTDSDPTIPREPLDVSTSVCDIEDKAKWIDEDDINGITSDEAIERFAEVYWEQ